MSLFLDSFWRALAYCLLPRVIVLSLLPLALMVTMALGLGYFFWDSTLEWVRQTLESYEVVSQIQAGLQRFGLGGLNAVVVPLLVIFSVTPLIIVVALLIVTLLMSPALVTLVSQRRFADLEQKRGGSLVLSLLWTLGSILLALIALLVSIPLWFVPPLMVVLPPLIWGWLTYRVMAFDVLALHASADERRALLKKHRTGLLAIGVVSGYLGALPSLLWVSVPMVAMMFPVLVPTTIWVYTFVFAFSGLWFCHFCLAALQALRREAALAPGPVTSTPLPGGFDAPTALPAPPADLAPPSR